MTNRTVSAGGNALWRAVRGSLLGLVIAAGAWSPAHSSVPANTAGETAGAVQTPDIHPSDPAWEMCRNAARKVSHGSDLPAQLLSAMAVTETGMTVKGRREIAPWPWTINAAGQGMRFATREDAVLKTLELMENGVTSIDIGCMQINTRYHLHEFRNIDEAFDPQVNVAYARRFLTRLYKRLGSWTAAVHNYHSNTPADGAYYFSKVERIWADEKKRAQAFAAREDRKVARHLDAQADKGGRAVLASLGLPVTMALRVDTVLPSALQAHASGTQAPLRSVPGDLPPAPAHLSETVALSPRVRLGRPAHLSGGDPGLDATSLTLARLGAPDTSSVSVASLSAPAPARMIRVSAASMAPRGLLRTALFLDDRPGTADDTGQLTARH